MKFWEKLFRSTESKSGLELNKKYIDLWKTIEEDNMVIHLIGSGEIKRLDHSRIESEVQTSINAYKSGTRPLQTVHFGTDAYDNDPRALFDIPEIRSWCKALYQKMPFIFSILDAPTIYWFFPAVADIEVISRRKGSVKFTYRPGSLENIIAETMDSQKRLFSGLTETEEEYDQLVKDSLERIKEAIGS